MKLPDMKAKALGLLSLLCLLVAPPGCKDSEPCDPGQESVGTACFPVATGGSAAQAGAASDGGASDGGSPGGGAPAVGNPDATFATPCESDADCGGDAPVCATDPLFYCTQLNCSVGEANEGACPTGWTCFPKAADHPSACVNLQ